MKSMLKGEDWILSDVSSWRTRGACAQKVESWIEGEKRRARGPAVAWFPIISFPAPASHAADVVMSEAGKSRTLVVNLSDFGILSSPRILVLVDAALNLGSLNVWGWAGKLKPVSQRPNCLIHFLAALHRADPLVDAAGEVKNEGDCLHIRIQQRNGRKSLTTLQGLKESYDYNKVLKALKKDFCCNGSVVEDSELGKVIQLQGDQRKNASEFLIKQKLVKKDAIKIHGF
eukprot:gene28502-31658_t